MKRRVHKGGSLVYADDVALIAPTVKGLQILLSTCESFAEEFDVAFNSAKSVCIHFGKHSSTCHPEVRLNDAQLAWSRSIKHLGNIITADLTDKADIKLKTNDLVRRINSLVANFRHLSREAVVKLFDSQCAFYGAQQWNLSDKKALDILHHKFFLISRLFLLLIALDLEDVKSK